MEFLPQVEAVRCFIQGQVLCNVAFWQRYIRESAGSALRRELQSVFCGHNMYNMYWIIHKGETICKINRVCTKGITRPL